MTNIFPNYTSYTDKIIDNLEDSLMGKGDKRTKRGKIFRGSHGNSRPKSNKSGDAVAKPTPKKGK